MPNQNRKRKAGETSLQGLGITLVATGAGMLNNGVYVEGIIAVAAGLLLLYVSITFRNASIGVKPDEVLEAIEKSKDAVVGLTEDESN